MTRKAASELAGGASSSMASVRDPPSKGQRGSSTSAASLELGLCATSGRIDIAVVDEVGAGDSTSIGPASTAVQSLPTQAWATAGKKNPRPLYPSSQRVRTTAPATKSDSAASAPKIQPGSDLMRSS